MSTSSWPVNRTHNEVNQSDVEEQMQGTDLTEIETER